MNERSHRARPEITLNARFLGRFEICVDTRPITLPTSRRARSLLAFLLLNPKQRWPRERLALDICSDDPDNASRKYIRQAIWQIGRSFRSAGTDPNSILHKDCELIGLADTVRVRTDLEHLDNAAAHSSDISLDEFLPGLDDDWVSIKRENLRAQIISMLEQTALASVESPDYEQRIRCCERILRLDPFREDVAEVAMRTHAHHGNVGKVAGYYNALKQVYQDELGIEPAIPLDLIVKQARVAATSCVRDIRSVDTRIVATTDLCELLEGLRQKVDRLTDQLRRNAHTCACACQNPTLTLPRTKAPSSSSSPSSLPAVSFK